MLLSKIIKKKFDAVLGRYDGTDACYYFSPKDFPEMKSESFNVTNDKGAELKGFFYCYGEIRTDRLVVFDHGIGAGHLAYFKEIEILAKNGYTVYSYDHMGCVDSEGSGILGFAQGVSDLNSVLNAIRADDRFDHSEIILIGHSWGGYSSMNAAALHPEVTHVVSLAGFLSARSLIEQYLPKFVMKYSEEVMDRERENNPLFADMDARESLKKTNAKFMHIQSSNDMKVKFELCYPLLQDALKDRENTEFICVNNRNHEPHHTEKAAKAYADMMEDLDFCTKKKLLSTAEQRTEFRKKYDWDAITEQDSEIWGKILSFIKD